MDDSGSRNPDHEPAKPRAQDFFAMGGIFLNEEDEGHARGLHDGLCARWKVRHALHSVDIRHGARQFSWLRTADPREKIRFYSAIHDMMRNARVAAIACVIDRPGYNARYRELYGNKRWLLCKTAVSIVLERAARVAIERGRQLRVFVERCSRQDDANVRRYYEELRANGAPFEVGKSAKYAPLTADELRSALYDLKFKRKSSEMIQLADLALYPVARGGYEEGYMAYKRMMEDGCVIDCHLSAEDRPFKGVKYSCFEGVRRN